MNLLQHSASISADQDLESGFNTNSSNRNNTNNNTNTNTTYEEEINTTGRIREYFEQSR
jgi:hypothetical protein